MRFEPPKEDNLSTKQLNLNCPQRVLYSEVPLYTRDLLSHTIILLQEQLERENEAQYAQK